jgi:hypothetical protein
MRTTTDGCFVCPSLFIVAPKRFSENKYSYKCHYSLRCCTSRVCAGSTGEKRKVGFMGIQHAGLLVDNVEKALEFYLNVLGMEDASKERPNLPYKGAFIQVGPQQQIHLMELPSVDPKTGRPAHGGRDRHIALQVSMLGCWEQVYLITVQRR